MLRERQVRNPLLGAQVAQTEKVLQWYDGYEWRDVPLEDLTAHLEKRED